MNEREALEEQGALKKKEVPLIKRMTFLSINQNASPLVDTTNIAIRNSVYSDIISNKSLCKSLPDVLDSNSLNDLLIGEIDRYGLPIRTVLNRSTGLIRTDPYYNENWLNTFYSKYYRKLYSNRSHASILAEQINRGERYLNYLQQYLNGRERILEIGCGMGGILVPFKLNGFFIEGIDLGEEFINIGKELNLNLFVASIDDIINQKEKYDLIILSHLIEHIPDLEAFFVKLKKLLTPRGKVFIAVPGVKKIHQTYHSNVLMYFQNAHCWSFSQSTLNAFLIKMGFSIIRSDDWINCIAILGESNSLNYDLKKEAEDILNYLLNIEQQYIRKHSRVFNLLKKVMNYLKIYFKGKYA